jgi:uncharacterized membrane protein YdjX (TVP38/TMEM64 family)
LRARAFGATLPDTEEPGVNARAAKSWAKMLAPVSASMAGLVALRLLGPDILDQRTLSSWIAPLGDFAPLAFILFLAVRPLTLLPGQFFTAVGGILFGARMATVYAVVGDTLAMVLVFTLARRFGTRLMQRLVKDRYEPLKRAAQRHDFKFALLATMSPLIPTDVAVAAAGAAGARMRHIVAGVVVATTPGIFLTTQFGSALSQGKYLLTLVSASGMVISLVLGMLLGRRIFHEVKDDGGHPQARVEGKPDEALREGVSGKPADIGGPVGTSQASAENTKTV